MCEVTAECCLPFAAAVPPGLQTVLSHDAQQNGVAASIADDAETETECRMMI